MKKTSLIIILIITGTITSFAQTTPGPLNIDAPSSGAALLVGRKDGQASIKSNNKGTGHLIIDSEFSKYVSLNHYTNDNVILGHGGGNVGIGTVNPTSRVDILSNTGQTESLMKFKVADAPGDYLLISNTTGNTGQFIPSIRGFHQTDNRPSLYIVGATSDNMDTGSNSLIDFNARKTNSIIQNRPLFSWTNYTTKMMTMTANGNLGIGTTTPAAKLEIQSTGAMHNRTPSLAIKDLTSRGTLLLESVTDKPTDFVFKNNNRNSWVMSTRASSDNYALRFFPSQNGTSWATPTLSLLTNGNVGIGTTNPEVKLGVSSGNSGDAILKIEADEDNNNESDNPMIQFRQDGGQVGINMGFSEENFGGNVFGIGTRYQNREAWNTFAINAGTGNVGIGTNAPSRLLEIRQKEDPNSDHGLAITEPNNDQKIFLHLANNTSGQYGFLSLGGQTSLRGNGKPSYFEGFVGVGTKTVDGYKLAVNGKIRAKEIKVEANWADYVFEEAYKLPTLQEVENHIQTKGHLINIPSAAEVAENGIQLGEMNSKLLEKIEELTLYTIAQEKKLKEQETRLAKLEALLLKK